MLVENDNATRIGLAELLWAVEYLCTAVASYEHARCILREHTPDLLIADVRLGRHNGLHLVIAAPEIPAIVISGFDDPALRIEAEQVGAAYLLKPVRIPDLLEVIAQRLRDTPLRKHLQGHHVT